MSKTKKRLRQKLKRGGANQSGPANQSVKRKRNNVYNIEEKRPEVNEEELEKEREQSRIKRTVVREQLFGEIEKIKHEQELEKETEQSRKNHGLSIKNLIDKRKMLKAKLSEEGRTLFIGPLRNTIHDLKKKINRALPIMYYNNNEVKVFNNLEQFGMGSTKKVSKRHFNNGWAYISPIIIEPNLKEQMRDDFKLALLLSRVCPKYFPKVEFVAETPLTYLSRKELCVEIVRSETLPDGTITFKGNLSREMLTKIIDTAIELLDNYGLFTLDFKPSNMGLLNGSIVFIDVDPAWSYLVKPEYDTTEYKSLIVLIVLVHSYRFSCFDCKLLTHADLRDLARNYIRKKNYKRLISGNYIVNTDPFLDLTFNKGIAPSFTQFMTPLEALNHYTVVDLDKVLSYLLDS